MKGVPVRVEVGSRDIENNKVFIARRDTGEKQSFDIDEAGDKIASLLVEIQQNMFNQAVKFQDENTFNVTEWSEFKSKVEQGGFIKCGWDGSEESEMKIKNETKATIRCIPFDESPENKKCIFSGQDAHHEAIFAKAY